MAIDLPERRLNEAAKRRLFLSRCCWRRPTAGRPTADSRPSSQAPQIIHESETPRELKVCLHALITFVLLVMVCVFYSCLMIPFSCSPSCWMFAAGGNSSGFQFLLGDAHSFFFIYFSFFCSGPD